jgi:RNA polymerase sigma factor (sigma-70 family)
MQKNSATSLRILGGLFDLGAASNVSDGQLLEHFATGPAATAEAAFAAILERHGPMVLRVCRAILRDEHSAMDAFQVTFLVLIRKSRSLWVRESLGPWLHRVASRAAARVKRESAQHRRLILHAARRTAEQGVIPPPSHRDELALALHEEVDRLPEHFRAAVLLCDLEGRTCEDTARLLACPVGTVASRLARGRRRLRARLERRGIGLLGSALAAALSGEIERASASVPAALRESTIRVALGCAATKTMLGASSSSLSSITTAVSRSLFLTKLKSSATLVLGVGLFAVAAASGIRTLASPGAPRAERQSEKPKQEDASNSAGATARQRQGEPVRFDFQEAKKDCVQCIVANMRLVVDNNRVDFDCRVGFLYKDGSLKLYRTDAKEPVAAALRHKGPIREFAFAEDFRLLVTTSDDSVKLWDGISGALRKELDGEFMRPLASTSMTTRREQGGAPPRFVTIDVAGRVITSWDFATLEPVGSFRPEGTAKLLGAGLSPDGKTLATIADDRSVTLWSASSNKRVVTLQEPSPIVAGCFPKDGSSRQRERLLLDNHFWDAVAPLLPAKL